MVTPWSGAILYLSVFGPDHAIVPHRVVGVLELFRVEHVTTDHYACAALAGLAVDACHVLVVGFEPVVEVDAEVVDEPEGGRLVVLEGELGYHVVEH
jgi:hypothetical protein